MAPHQKINSTLPHEEREVASECRYRNRCVNVPNGQTRTQKADQLTQGDTSLFLLLSNTGVRFYCLLILDTIIMA